MYRGWEEVVGVGDLVGFESLNGAIYLCFAKS